MRPSRFLVAMFQGGGNIPLLLPIVTRLAALGHHVRFIVGPGVRRSRLPLSEGLYRSLRDISSDTVRLREPEIHPFDVSPGKRGLAFGWAPRMFHSVAAEACVARWIPHWAREVALDLEREPADVVAADFVLVGALVAAEAAGVPSPALVHTVYPPARGRPPYGPGWQPAVGIAGLLRDAVGTFVSNRIHAREALPFVNLARQTCGLSPIRGYFDQYDRASRVVVLTSAEFDTRARFPPNVRLVGTPLEDEPPLPELPAWSTEEGCPLVLVSLSTLEQGQAALMERILGALSGLPVRALVTLGPALAKARLTPPSNVVLETFVPHGSVLPHAAAIVTQGGLGTVMKALAHGVPLVCIPLVGDQADNAARIEALGAGVRLSPDVEPGRIRSALARVLTDRAFRLGAQRVARAIAGNDAAQAAVDEIPSILPSAVRCSP